MLDSVAAYPLATHLAWEGQAWGRCHPMTALSAPRRTGLLRNAYTNLMRHHRHTPLSTGDRSDKEPEMPLTA
jgi:hypothetical protein